MRQFHQFVLGFSVGAMVTLAFASYELRQVEGITQQVERLVDRLIHDREERAAADVWRAKYGRWVQLVENPDTDPPPPGAR